MGSLSLRGASAAAEAHHTPRLGTPRATLKIVVHPIRFICFVISRELLVDPKTVFKRKNSFEAEEGCNDDLAMCLVIFAWLVAQPYFKEMTDNDVRKKNL
jgi:hypothetical protein